MTPRSSRIVDVTVTAVTDSTMPRKMPDCGGWPNTSHAKSVPATRDAPMAPAAVSAPVLS